MLYLISVTSIFQMSYWIQWNNKGSGIVWACVNMTWQRMKMKQTDLVYQVHTVDPMLLFVDTGAPHSCIRDKALERNVWDSWRRSIPINDSIWDFKFSDSLARSRSVVELMLETPGSTPDTLVIFDVVDVDIPVFLGINILDRNNLLVDSVTNHLWNHKITNKDTFRFEDIWNSDS